MNKIFNKKSFEVNKDENKSLKSTERLYQPKNFRWCKYIVLPLLVGFILLLILTNVDFTGDTNNNNSRSWSETNARIFSIDNTIQETLSRINNLLSRAVNCIASTDSCSLICAGGNVNNLYKDLEALYKSCQRDMDLKLIDCQIPSGRLKSDFFAGNYRLKSINITNCNLNSIQPKAFQQEAVKNLLKLTLIKTQFVNLDESAFEGLLQLESFSMVNTKGWSNFNGKGFLKHFSETLTNLNIQQESSSADTYDPLMWLQSNDMKILKNMSLANNNFGGLVKQTTFSTLVSVEYLDLSNSCLSYLPSNTFDKILRTLKFLNLSCNKLSTLSGEMLLQMRGMQVGLSFNEWHCSCDNKDMLQIIQWNLNEIDYLKRSEIRCYTPIEERDIALDKVQLDCLMRTTTQSAETAETVGIITTSLATNQTTISSSNTTSSSSSSSNSSTTTRSSSSSSSEISESSSPSILESSPGGIDTNDTTKVNTIPTTAMTTTSTTIVRTTTTTPIIETTTLTLLPSPQLPRIYCHTNTNELYSRPIIAKKWQFSLKPLNNTTIKLLIQELFHKPAVIYFAKDQPGTIVSSQGEHNNQIFFIIENLNPNASYVFCLLEQLKDHKVDFNWNISPLDCLSYSHPIIFPQAWLKQEDQVWIISLVVLGTCLMLLLGIILMLICMRQRKHCSSKHRRTLNNDLEKDSDNYQQQSTGRPHPSRLQPPDVVAQHSNYEYSCNHDLYEELIM